MEPYVAEPLVALMRRYCIDYTARHDLSVCDDIMVPGYTLHMGTHDLVGPRRRLQARGRRPSSASSPGCA
jgi:patatin-like phospholipase/acyl hydrolase